MAKEKVPSWMGAGTLCQGEALVMLGEIQEGMAQMRKGMATLLDY